MGYSLLGGFTDNRKTPGALRIPETPEQYKTRGVFQLEHPSCFIPQAGSREREAGNMLRFRF
jgi:hypothetical protein